MRPSVDITISASRDWSVAIFTTSLESQECYLTLRNLTLQITRDFFRLHSAIARLYNAAASPASRLRSAGSLAIIIFFYCCALWFLIADDVRNCFRQCGDNIEIPSTPRILCMKQISTDKGKQMISRSGQGDCKLLP